ncbi:MAG TPA: type II toxin-antitoxin system RelE/ParE family toxin, partial [Candidatus Cloacimonetes bacterium]|nr:type II toxin-antitoxin system RelE/ParE family toxin [Candidatus Cloacimonadota bacterium]
KKSNPKLQLEIDKQINIIIKNPEISILKKGDLKNYRIHNFKFNQQLYLISYLIYDDILSLYLIGTHENFYKILKKFIYH